MLTNGKLTSGKRSMPSRIIDTTPSTMKLMMNIVAKTGRRMERSEIHITRLLHEDRVHFAAGPHVLAGIGHDRVSRLEAGGNLDHAAVGQPFSDGHFLDGVVIDPQRDATAAARGHRVARY